MKKLFLFQIKNMRRFLFTIAAVSFLVCVGWFCFLGIRHSSTDYTRKICEEYQRKEALLSSEVQAYFENNQGLDEASGEELKEKMEEQSELLSKMADARKSGDWRQELSLAIKQGEGELWLVENIRIAANVPKINDSIKLYQYLLEHDVEPKTPSNACDGWNVLVMYAKQFLPFLIPVLAMLFGAFGFITERLHGGIKLLLQTPFSRTGMIICKMGAALFMAVLSVTVTAVGAFAICSALFGVGNRYYPILCDNGNIITTESFLLQILLLAVCGVLFFTAFGMLLAVLIKNESILAICAVALPLLSFAVQSQMESRAAMIPLMSVNLSAVILKGAAPVGVLCAAWLGFSVLCAVLACLFFKKKDLL